MSNAKYAAVLAASVVGWIVFIALRVSEEPHLAAVLALVVGVFCLASLFLTELHHKKRWRHSSDSASESPPTSKEHPVLEILATYGNSSSSSGDRYSFAESHSLDFSIKGGFCSFTCNDCGFFWTGKRYREYVNHPKPKG